MATNYPWHQLFGLLLTDFFTDEPVTVEMEKDLSFKQQLLDVVLIRQSDVPLTVALPDGLAPLAAHNLISFKSHQDTLDSWAVQELVGHAVNYRKQVSPSMQRLWPATDFRLFAVCARYPQGLARIVPLVPVSAGVYDVDAIGLTIRVVVTNDLPLTEQNAALHLFASRGELLAYGAQHYRQRSPASSRLMHLLWQKYRAEGVSMPITLAELARQVDDEILKRLPAEKRLEGLSPATRLEGLSEEDVQEYLSRLRRLAPNSPAAPGAVPPP